MNVHQALAYVVIGILLAGCGGGLRMLSLGQSDVDKAWTAQDEATLFEICSGQGRGMLDSKGGAIPDHEHTACAYYRVLQWNALEAKWNAGEKDYVDKVCAGDIDPETQGENTLKRGSDPRKPEVRDNVSEEVLKVLDSTNSYTLKTKSLACAFRELEEREGKRMAKVADTVDASQVTEVAVVDTTAACPGGETRLTFQITMADGTTKKTWADSKQKHGFVDHGMFTVTSDHGTFKDNMFYATSDLSQVLEGISVKVTVAENPSVAVDQTLDVDFSCMGGLYFYGKAGESGANGSNGVHESVLAQGEGKDGEDGGNGSDGGDGSAGHALEVHLGVVASERYGKVVVARGKAPTEDKVVWFARPLDQYEGLEIVSAGGSGGRGGSGGSGANGQDTTGTDNRAPSGDGGNGGKGGAGGNGGKGGSITLLYDKNHKGLVSKITMSTPGGKAGSGGSYGNAGSKGGSYTQSYGQDGERGDRGKDGKSGSKGSDPKKKAVSGSKLFDGKLKLSK